MKNLLRKPRVQRIILRVSALALAIPMAVSVSKSQANILADMKVSEMEAHEFFVLLPLKFVEHDHFTSFVALSAVALALFGMFLLIAAYLEYAIENEESAARDEGHFRSAQTSTEAS